MTQQLYVVMGSTGEYSDRQEWPVRAFVEQVAAQRFVVEATAWLRDRGFNGRPGASVEYRARDSNREPSPFDPGLAVDYTGTTYYIMDVPLDDSVRQEIAATVADDLAHGRLTRAIAVGGGIGDPS